MMIYIGKDRYFYQIHTFFLKKYIQTKKTLYVVQVEQHQVVKAWRNERKSVWFIGLVHHLLWLYRGTECHQHFFCLEEIPTSTPLRLYAWRWEQCSFGATRAYYLMYHNIKGARQHEPV